MKKEVILNIDSDISLTITGKYFEAEIDNGLPEAFEIDEIVSNYRDLVPLLEYVNSKREGEILSILEEKILQKL